MSPSPQHQMHETGLKEKGKNLTVVSACLAVYQKAGDGLCSCITHMLSLLSPQVAQTQLWGLRKEQFLILVG